jgi:diaminopimelate epimerase
MRFVKYQALGNDYIVLDSSDATGGLTAEQIRRICHRNYGVGADGLLLGPLSSPTADFALRIFNPDGGEAEKSGNGLRIFARYLYDKGLVREAAFTVSTKGGVVRAQVHEAGKSVTVEMGRVSFDSRAIPVSGPPREVLNETLALRGEPFTFCAATIGNPHCVVLNRDVTPGEAKRWGPLIEVEPRFPNRTNVQFLKVLDRGSIRIEIWERGAGYTLASGSSSCTAAAVAHRLGLCGPRVDVRMPGGVIQIEISPDYAVTMKGPAAKVCEGDISDETLWTARAQEFAADSPHCAR